MRRLIALILALSLFAGCAGTRQPSSTYGVSADGTVTAETRSALNGSTAPGRQELIGVYLPFPPFALKMGVEWDGTTFNPIPTQVAPSAAAPCVETTYVTETYVEHVPVQRTRQVPQQRVSLPVPPRAVNPCPEPIAQVGP